VSYSRTLICSDNSSDTVLGTTESTATDYFDSSNIALCSTFVVQGFCEGIVFATGDATVMGKLVEMSVSHSLS
jgi:sodium/potassium-transporting ATPase subunit alpha